DGDGAGRKASEALEQRLGSAGLAVRVANWPQGIKDANELLVSAGADAPAAFRRALDEAASSPGSGADFQPAAAADPAVAAADAVPAAEVSGADPGPSLPAIANRDAEALTLSRGAVTYQARVHGEILGRLRATVKAVRGASFHVDSLDLYASRSRAD